MLLVMVAVTVTSWDSLRASGLRGDSESRLTVDRAGLVLVAASGWASAAGARASGRPAAWRLADAGAEAGRPAGSAAGSSAAR